MNNILKATLRINGLRSLLNPVKNYLAVSAVNQQRQIQRSLWSMCNSRSENGITNVHSHLCSCGCGGSKRNAHTKGRFGLS